MNPVREQIRSMLRSEQREGGFRARFTLDPNFVLLPDHFRTQPIFPGICMLQAVLLAGAASLGVPELHLFRLKNSKLLQPIQPGDNAVIDADMTDNADGNFVIKARISVGDQKRAEFSLTARIEPTRAGVSA